MPSSTQPRHASTGGLTYQFVMTAGRIAVELRPMLPARCSRVAPGVARPPMGARYSGIFSVITASRIAARLRQTSTSVALPIGVAATTHGSC